MMRNIQVRNSVATALCVILVLQLVSCGTLIHPERRGQTDGRIDPSIAILDGIGILFFIIPGLIAFAIDFSTGAKPPGQSRWPNRLSPAPSVVYD